MNIPTIGDIAGIIEKLKILREKLYYFINEKHKDISVDKYAHAIAALPIDEYIDPQNYTEKLSAEQLLRSLLDFDSTSLKGSRQNTTSEKLLKFVGMHPKESFEDKLKELPIDELERLLNKFIPKLLADNEILITQKRKLHQIENSVSRELKRKEKRKGDIAKIIETIKKIELHRGMPKRPKKIQDLINEVVKLLFPFWDYLKGKGSWGEKEQPSIEALIRAGKPSYLDMVTQELEKIKYNMEVEAKQKDPEKPAETEPDIPPTKDKKKKAKIACLFKKIICWIFKKTSHVIIAIIVGLIVAILVDIFADFGWIERIKAVIYKILQLN